MPETIETPLQGWKEIAAYLERDERTARRWEKEEGLPIRRHRAEKRSSVYAYPSELEAWRVERPVKAADAAVDETAGSTAPSPASRPWVWTAVAAMFVLGGFVLFLRSPSFDPIAEAGAAAGGVKTTEIRKAGTVGMVSPDGRYLSETDWVRSGDIGIRDLQTGEYRRLSDKGSWGAGFGEADRSIFSPDGKQIAYNWLIDRSGELRYELRIIDAFAAEPKARTIYFNEGLFYIQPDAWGADGRLLVQFQRSDWSWGIGFVSIDSGEFEVVKSVPTRLSGLQLSHDGRWIGYSTAPDTTSQIHEVYLLASDGSEEKSIGNRGTDAFVAGFSVDDRTLLYVSNRTGVYGLWGADIESGGRLAEPRLLVRDLGSVAPMGVLPDGSFIYKRAMGALEIYSAELDLATGKLLRKPEAADTDFHGENEGPWLSPDGRKLAYFAMPPSFQLGARDKNRQLRIHDIESGEEEEVGLEGVRLQPYYSLAWSPEGNRLLGVTNNGQGRWGLVEVDTETGSINQIRGAEDPPSRPIGWRADGRTVLYKAEPVEFEEGGVTVKTIEAIRPGQPSGERLYSSKGVASGGRILENAMSHQRDRIAWREFTKGGETIKVMSVEGGEARIVFQPNDGWSARSLAWAPDGKTLLVQRRSSPSGEGGLWIVPLDGRQAFRSELSDLYLTNLNVHPDGKTIYFQSGYRDPRIFKTENYLAAQDGATE